MLAAKSTSSLYATFYGKKRFPHPSGFLILLKLIYLLHHQNKSRIPDFLLSCFFKVEFISYC